jgi:hypothetical protein
MSISRRLGIAWLVPILIVASCSTDQRNKVEPLKTEEIRAAVAGRLVQGKGDATLFLIRFEPDGTMAYEGGTSGKGRWHEAEGGLLCLQWANQKENCAPLARMSFARLRWGNAELGIIDSGNSR